MANLFTAPSDRNQTDRRLRMRPEILDGEWQPEPKAVTAGQAIMERMGGGLPCEVTMTRRWNFNHMRRRLLVTGLQRSVARHIRLPHQ